MIINGHEVRVMGRDPLPTDHLEEYEEMTLQEFMDSQKLSDEQQAQIIRDQFAVNIHFMLAQETYDRAFEVVEDIATDPRLTKMRAIVFLSHKPKGRNKQRFHALRDIADWRRLIEYATVLGVSFGMDSCSAPMILKSYEGTPEYDRVSAMIEPCEAYLFSSYVSADGEFFPCSFTEGQPGWETGIDVLGCTDFVKDVWNHPRAEEWRNRLLGSTQGCVSCSSQPLCRACPAFPITACVFPR